MKFDSINTQAIWTEKFIPWFMTSGPKILGIILFSFIFYYLGKTLFKKLIRISVRQANNGDANGEKQREQTLIQIMVISLKSVIILIAGIMITSEFNIKVGPLIASAGVVGLAVGFGGQYLIRDIISGLFIILENQYRINDYVRIAGIDGKVERITLRTTTLRDQNGVTHYVPHGEIKTVSNQSNIFSRVNLDLRISYGTDIAKVEKIVNEIGVEMMQIPYWKELLLSSPHFLRVQDLSDNAIVVKIIADTKPSKQWEVTGELRRRLYEALKSNNIDIPTQTTNINITQKPDITES